MAKNKRRYYANNWLAIKETPSSFFPEMPFIQMMDWKVAGWEIPSSVDCILRCTDKSTGKVTEYTYVRRGAAENKVKKLMALGAYEFVIVDHNEIHNLYPHPNDEESNTGSKTS